MHLPNINCHLVALLSCVPELLHPVHHLLGHQDWLSQHHPDNILMETRSCEGAKVGEVVLVHRQDVLQVHLLC